MKIEKVQIRNFRSIKDPSEIKIDSKVTCLMGKNESGKTNFLKALESFNLDYEYIEEDICSYSEVKEKLERGDIEPEDIDIITAWFEIENEDRKKLKDINKELAKIKHLKITKYYSNQYEVESPECGIEDLEVEPKNTEEIVENIKLQIDDVSTKLQQHTQRYPPFASSKPQYDQFAENFLSTDFTNISNVEQAFTTLYANLRGLPNIDATIQTDIENTIKILEQIKGELITELQEDDIIGKILELIPNSIYFDAVDLLKDSIEINEFLKNRPQYKTFDNLINLAGLDVEKLTEKPTHRRRSSTEEASARITGRVNELWRQGTVNVKIGYDGGTLFVYIEDKTEARDPPSRRSDGFQWFLSFYINFMAGTKGEFKNAVILLDNPGVLIHPSGQKDLLKTIEQIAESNQIVYTTHSPFLIDREHLNTIRIFQKKERKVGTIIKEKFHDSDFDALEPIRAAIGATIGDSLFGLKKNAIVEGYSDYLILEGVSHYFQRNKKGFLDFSKVAIISVGGAQKVPYFTLFVWRKGYKFVIILDNDNEGREVARELKEKYPIDASLVFKLDEIAPDKMQGRDITIEDLIDPSFYNKAVNEAYKVCFRKKRGEEEIKLDELDTSVIMQTKKYEKFFSKNRLGRFDKTLVAKQVYNMTSDISCTDDVLGTSTIENFDKLFEIVNDKLKI